VIEANASLLRAEVAKNSETHSFEVAAPARAWGPSPKQAISRYKKAVGELAGLAELMVFYCERAAGFCNDLGSQDEGYLDALVRTFEQALKVTDQLPANDRNVLIARLDHVRTISHNLGYGVGDDMDSLLAKYSRTDRRSAPSKSA
jgi:hypothetical protein